MPRFNLSNQNVLFTTYEQFVKLFNIYNNEILNETNLNKGINQLKREFNNIFGLFKILTGTMTHKWQPNIVYEPGEIVTYILKDNPSDDEIADSFYISLPNSQENISYQPDIYTNFWQKIHLLDIFPHLNFRQWLKGNDNYEWTPIKDFDVINIKFFNEKLEEFKNLILNLLNNEYIKKDNEDDLNVTKPNNVTTKKYVDNELQKLKDSLGDINNLLGDYVKVDNSNKLITKFGTSAIRTTDSGFLPGLKEISKIGDPNNIFHSMYAKDFHGTALRAKYADLAEIYETDKIFEPGTILGISETGISEFNGNNTYIGVVSSNPGLIINEGKPGVLIALKGQVPVKVIGKVKKGDYLIAYKEYAKAKSKISFKDYLNLVGIALESSEIKNLKLINTKV